MNRLAEIDTQSLVRIFNQLFSQAENTILQMGATEPFYQAAKDDGPAIIFAREDYFSSALHEIAHWTIAGKSRRAIDDFGYWYEPEGRSFMQQSEFEQVEIKPQAIEWLLSLACCHPFHFSADNLTQGIGPSESFQQAVVFQTEEYLSSSLPNRAQLLFEELKRFYRKGKEVEISYV